MLHSKPEGTTLSLVKKIQILTKNLGTCPWQREDGQITWGITWDCEWLNEMVFLSLVYNRSWSPRNGPKGYVNSELGLITVEPGGVHQWLHWTHSSNRGGGSWKMTKICQVSEECICACGWGGIWRGVWMWGTSRQKNQHEQKWRQKAHGSEKADHPHVSKGQLMRNKGRCWDSRGLLCFCYDMLSNIGGRFCSAVDGAANTGFEIEVGEVN